MVKYLPLLVVLSTISGTVALTCFKCSQAASLEECKMTETCTDNQVCYKKREYKNQVKYTLGCMDKENCGTYANIRNTSEGSKMNAKDTSFCYECCSKDKCNVDICDYPSNTQCKDDKSVDCARLNSMFSICKLTNEAKKICPKYCSLCNVVDGNWSPWASWSSCDVTCGKGSKLRIRACSNPAPENGGIDCPGRGTEKKPCHLQLCPVHGGWSSWDNWGTCSATCGIGMRSRTRSCTNPRPERFGDHCFGDSNKVELCNRGICTKNVAFNAYTTKSNGHYPEGSVLIFSKVSLNEGQGYDPSTGKFKAPVAGVYQFTAHICHQPKIDMVIAIMNGMKQIATTTEFENSKSSCHSVSVIDRVKENEDVYVKARWSLSHLRSDMYRWPSFSGFLLHR